MCYSEDFKIGIVVSIVIIVGMIGFFISWITTTKIESEKEIRLKAIETQVQYVEDDK